MRICAAQTNPVLGDVEKNIEEHKRFIDAAIENEADLIFFPELSITRYDSHLAKDLATEINDKRFDDFQKIADENEITIAISAPTKSDSGVLISLIFFQPEKRREIYSKQKLHSDELPFFVEGETELFLDGKDEKIAPAICYESMLIEHSEKAVQNGANIYLTSVAKSADGVERGYKHYAEIAKKYSMTVLMSNCLGKCDDFESVGQTAAWNDKGELAGKLDDTREGILIFDTETNQIIEKYL